MSVTVTVEELRQVFKTTLIDSDLEIFVGSASLIVDEEFSGSDLSAARLHDIAMYLSAHYASTASPRLETERSDTYSYRVQGKTAMGLNNTFYGQMALSLDTSGTLTRMSKSKVSIGAYKESDQTVQ